MNKIKELRKSKGMSQKELADLLYVNQTAVSQWERGITYPNQNTIKKLADYFDVTIDCLLGHEKMPSDNAPESISSKITDLFNQLDDNQQKIALDYLEFLLSRDNKEK